MLKAYLKYPIISSTYFCNSQNIFARQLSYFSFRTYIRCGFFPRHKQLQGWKIACGKLQRIDLLGAHLAIPNTLRLPWVPVLTSCWLSKPTRRYVHKATELKTLLTTKMLPVETGRILPSWYEHMATFRTFSKVALHPLIFGGCIVVSVSWFTQSHPVISL